MNLHDPTKQGNPQVVGTNITYLTSYPLLSHSLAAGTPQLKISAVDCTETMHAAIDTEWPKRLRANVSANCGHFEN